MADREFVDYATVRDLLVDARVRRGEISYEQTMALQHAEWKASAGGHPTGDLKTDPKEMKSVYGNADYAKIQKRLAKQLAKHRSDLKVPDADPPHSIVKRLPPRLRKPTVPK